MTRIFVGLPLAALVTGVLFVLMQALVAPGAVDTTPPPPRLPINIFAERTDPVMDVPEAPIATLAEAPAPPDFDFRGPATRGPVYSPVAPADLKIDPGDMGPSSALIAVATLAPQFPPHCQARGTEGFAIVRYDVTAVGQVTNAEVIESSHRCFEKAALQAIRGWRYQPAAGASGLIGRGITRRFSFELNEA